MQADLCLSKCGCSWRYSSRNILVFLHWTFRQFDFKLSFCYIWSISYIILPPAQSHNLPFLSSFLLPEAVGLLCYRIFSYWLWHHGNWSLFTSQGNTFQSYCRDKQTPTCCSRGSRWHCATSRKVAGSIPEGVIGIFHRHNPSGRTMSLGSTQSLKEMSTRNFSYGVKAAGA